MSLHIVVQVRSASVQGPCYCLCLTPTWGPQCIVGVGAAERSHLLQDNSNVLSPEKEGWRTEANREIEEVFVDKNITQ